MHQYESYETVDSVLTENGYRESKRRKYPDLTDTWFVLFVHDDWPMIGFPTSKGKVLRDHFDRIKMLIELYRDDEKN